LTVNFRALKKLTYFLVEKCASKNMYKRGSVEEYLCAFSEAQCSFLFSINAFDENRLVESFVEFIVVFFPIDKVNYVIDTLIEQNG